MRFNEETTMQLKVLAILSAGLSVAIMLPVAAAQPAPPSAAQAQVNQIDRRASDMVAHPSTPGLRRQPQFEAVDDSVSRPVITEPTAGTTLCCESNYGLAGRVDESLDIHGEGVPGHLVKVMVTLDNDGARSLEAQKWTTVGEDGLWRVRWMEVSSTTLTRGAFVEIDAVQVFPATRVREEDKEVAALPVILKFYRSQQHTMPGQTFSSPGN